MRRAWRDCEVMSRPARGCLADPAVPSGAETGDGAGAMPPLDPALYALFCDLVYARSGLSFDERKTYFVERRLQQRIEETGASSALDYYHGLRYGDDGRELELLCEALTVNETYFFREYPQLKVFAENCLQEVLQQKRARDNTHLRLWSAGCATGEEPYTLAIILREMIEDLDRWTFDITATDICKAVLDVARGARYGERSLKDVPDVYRQRYFRRDGESFRVDRSIARIVEFRHANVLDESAALDIRNQDFIFCRNVLIYLDEAARRRAVELLHGALRPGGYIFLGHSESVSRITTGFEPVRMAGQIVYRK